MSRDRLLLAAGLAFIYALVTRPLMALVSGLITRPDLGARLVTVLVAGVGFAIFAFLFFTFKRVLNERYRFHRADLPTLALIGLNAIGTALTLLPLVGVEWKTTLPMFQAVWAAYGLALIAFGFLLLKLSDDLSGFLKPYAFVVIAAGVGITSIRFVVFGVLLGVVASILLGLIFFKESGKGQESAF